MSLLPRTERALLSGHRTIHGPAHAEAIFTNVWTLDLTLAGQVRFAHPEGDFLLQPRELLLVRPQHHKSWFVPAQGGGGEGRGGRGSPEPGRWEVVWFAFEAQGRMLARMQYPEIRPGHIRLRLRGREAFERVSGCLRKAHELAIGPHSGREELALHAIEEALLWCHQDQQRAAGELDPRVEAALRFLHAHLDKPIRIAEVAKACRVSRARLLALFVRQVGIPMMTYLEQERLRRAKRLLAETRMPLKEVAWDVGFSDPRYFARRFKRAAGLRPSAWRRSGGRGR